MKKSFPSDDSSNFSRSSLNRLIQSEQHHRTILPQVPAWFLTHSHSAPPAFFCWQCQILSLPVLFIHHPKGILHMPGILLKVAQQGILLALKPWQGRDGPALSPPSSAGPQPLPHLMPAPRATPPLHICWVKRQEKGNCSYTAREDATDKLHRKSHTTVNVFFILMRTISSSGWYTSQVSPKLW